MRDYITWDFSGDEIKQDAIDGMGELVKTEQAAIESSDITKSEYIAKEAWGYYPWVECLFKKAEIVIGKKIQGKVADIGSGTGVVASILSKFEFVKEVFAVEYSEDFVKKIMPITFQNLEAKEEKITRVVGSFNQLKVVDNFFDFICEVNSLHHSENLEMTLKELHRVLKPGGYIIAADGAHNNKVSTEYLSSLLDLQMSDQQKKLYGLPQDFTRGMWGEHEYRYRDWKTACERNGFKAYAFSFTQRNPKILGSFAKVFFRIFGNFLLKRKVDFIPYYRWFFPFFRGSNMLLIAECIKD